MLAAGAEGAGIRGVPTRRRRQCFYNGDIRTGSVVMLQQAYRKAQTIAERPRAVEHRLMTEITGEMIAARAAGRRREALMPALHRNREVWSTFSAVCGAAGNQLPKSLRASMISLSIWVDRFTSDVVAGREPIDALIDVNLAVIEGLAPNSAEREASVANAN
jgi:flagellar protein FlaF